MLRAAQERARADPKARKVALGFRVHSGWTAVVAVSGSPRSPSILVREEIALANAAAESKQPYHAAEKLELAAADLMVRRRMDASRILAQVAVARVRRELEAQHCSVAACGILVSAAKVPTELARILASHALIHAAEGEMFRDVIVRACRESKLPITAVLERELFALSAQEFGMKEEELNAAIAAMGKTVGPPWGEDQKKAALVGWLALNGAAGRE